MTESDLTTGKTDEAQRRTDMFAAARAVARARQAGDPIVAFRTVGERSPVFLFPGRSGRVFAFEKYARHLGIDRPVYAVQPPGADGRPAPIHIASVARRHVVEIQGLQPEGPYHLVGVCAGGALAFEVARLLAAAGHRVETLALVDSWNPRHAKWRLAGRRFLRQYRLRTGGRQRAAYVARFGGRALTWAVLHPLRKPYRVMGKPIPRLLRYSSVPRAVQDANDFRPRPYDGDILLVTSRDLRPGRGIRADLGWASVASGVEVVPLDDIGHSDVTDDDAAIAAVCAVVRRRLDGANRR